MIMPNELYSTKLPMQNLFSWAWADQQSYSSSKTGPGLNPLVRNWLEDRNLPTNYEFEYDSDQIKYIDRCQVRFKFGDHKAALLFKLTWGGR